MGESGGYHTCYRNFDVPYQTASHTGEARRPCRPTCPLNAQDVMNLLLKFCIGVACLVCLGLLVTGHRILVWERKVNPGDHYVVEGWGDLGAAQQASLACYYFTGRSFKLSVFWYGMGNVMGKDECPATLKPGNSGDSALNLRPTHEPF
jgi:hypothetical protein